MSDSSANPVPRVNVGTHYRVWWFWLPVILGSLAMLSFLAFLPVARFLSMMIGCGAIACFVWATVSGIVIVRGRRWCEFDGEQVRVIGRLGTVEFSPGDVVDLTIHRGQHHAAGRLVAELNDYRIGVKTSDGRRTVRLTTRVPPGGTDPLEEVVDRLSDELAARANDLLSRGEPIAGEMWRLDGENLFVNVAKTESLLPLASITAVETIGQEVRIWTEGNPRAVVRLPMNTRNGWLLPRLLSMPSRPSHPTDVVAQKPHPASPLGRILFERSSGPVAMILFLVLGMIIAVFSLVTLLISIAKLEPVGIVLGVLLAIVSVLCLIGAFRVRRIRFCCYEHGLERVTITSRMELPFSSIDVFSFESRRNHSQGRYTGTTYTFVFADRSREQGRGIFFSTTVRNSDEELELLRERVSEVIAHRMARSFARTRRVQWTPELWFCDEVLEFTRPRRLLSSPKLAVVPYDTITDFEIRDGLFHIWTNYQERAVITVKTSSANFYPGLIVLEGLINAHVRTTVDEWVPTTSHTS